MKDISTRPDINLMVSSFYESVLEEVMLAPVFVSTLGADMTSHYERMADFWEDQILGSAKFEGNPMQVHLELAEKFNLDSDQFDVWLRLFNSTVDKLFVGPNAEKAKLQAENISTIMRVKMKL